MQKNSDFNLTSSNFVANISGSWWTVVACVVSYGERERVEGEEDVGRGGGCGFDCPRRGNGWDGKEKNGDTRFWVKLLNCSHYFPLISHWQIDPTRNLHLCPYSFWQIPKVPTKYLKGLIKVKVRWVIL